LFGERRFLRHQIKISGFTSPQPLSDWTTINHSATGCRWHMRILLRIPVARILWDFDFLRGLAPGRLDRFSIARYEKKRESFDFHAAKFESGAKRSDAILGENRPALEPFQNKVSSLVFLL